MKLKGLIATAAMSLLMGVGVFAGVKASGSDAKVEKAEAASMVIRFTRNTWNNATPYVYAYNSDSDKNANWPGWGMTYSYNNENNEPVYEVTFAKSYRYLIFSNNGGDQLETVDTNTTSNRGFYRGGGSSVGNYSLTSKYYFYDYDNKFGGSANCHYWNEYTSSVGGSTWPGPSMTNELDLAGNSRIYSISLDVKYNSLIFSKNGGYQTADLKPTAKMAPSNNYVFFKTDESMDHANEWWDNINYAYAHNFHQNIMNFRSVSAEAGEGKDTGYCTSGDNYSIAKSTYQAINSSTAIKNELLNNFSGTLDRLSKWAIANSESFNSLTGAFSSSAILNYGGLKTTTESYIIPAVVVSTIATLSAIGGFFFLKKKKSLM